MRAIFTIGYEGASIEDFVATLQAAGVDSVLDVRELPVSRRKGFSKSSLAAHLAGAGIGYRHERRLGSPTAVRNNLKSSGDYKKFFSEFDRYLKTQEEWVGQLVAELRGSVALVCYERNPDECHRRSVAEMMSSYTKLKPKHIGVPLGGTNAARQKASIHSRKSLSAA